MKQALVFVSLLFAQMTFASELPNCLDKGVDFIVSVNIKDASKEEILAVLAVGTNPRFDVSFPTVFPASTNMMLLLRPVANGVRVETLEETTALLESIFAPILEMAAVKVNCNYPISINPVGH